MKRKHGSAPSWLAAVTTDGAVICIALLVFFALAMTSMVMGIGLLPVPQDTRVIWDTASEANVWTWANVVVLSAAGWAHLGAARARWVARRPGWVSWVLTGTIMLLLSLDDAASFHERVLDPLGAQLGGGSGFLTFEWVVPGLFVGGLLSVAFATQLIHLRGTPAWYIAGGVVAFFGGALGMEMVSGWTLDNVGPHRAYVLVTTVEEFLEATGAVLLLAAALSDLPQRRLGSWLARDPQG